MTRAQLSPHALRDARDAAPRRRRRPRLAALAGVLAAAALLAAACTGGDDAPAEAASSAPATPTAETPATAATPGAAGGSSSAGGSSDASEVPPLTMREIDFLITFWDEFPKTAWNSRSVKLTDLDRPSIRDGIPAIDEPKFIAPAEAAAWLAPDEPVIALEIDGDARAYPLQILMLHEIVNDTLGGVPVIVTFCPLCNSALTFDRTVDGEVRDFGVSGLLRESDLVMFDRQTESFWQQLTGEAIIGEATGTRLRFLASQIASFEDFRSTFPDGVVLSRDTGFPDRAEFYGMNPYPGYDSVEDSLPFFEGTGENDGRLNVKERVLAIEIDGDAVAIPFSVLSEVAVVETTVGGEPVVALWQAGTRTALGDEEIRSATDVGSAAAFVPELDGEPLRFEARDGRIVDVGTGSAWSVLGRATDGPLAGAVLEPVLSGSYFWFAWAAFQPGTRVVRASDR